MSHILISCLFLVFQSCSPAASTNEEGGGGEEQREPRSIPSDGGFDAATVITGSVYVPASLVHGSVAGAQVFIDGNQDLSTETDANGFFSISLPTDFVNAVWKDGNGSLGVVVDTLFGDESFGIRKQTENIPRDLTTDTGRFDIQPFGNITGHVSIDEDGNTRAAPAAVDVFSSGGSYIVQTTDDGNYSIDLPMGAWTFVAYLDGYDTHSRDFDVAAATQLLGSDFVLFPKNKVSAAPRINDGNSITDSRTVTLKMPASENIRWMRISEKSNTGVWQAYRESLEYTFSGDDNGKMVLYFSFSVDANGEGEKTEEMRLEILYGRSVIENFGIDENGSLPFEGGSSLFSNKDQRYTIDANWHPVAFAIGDFNADSYPDIVIINDSAKSNFVFLNRKQGFDLQRTAIGTNESLHASSVAVGDFNKDGVDDFVIGFRDSWPHVYYGNSNGDFTTKKVLTTHHATTSVAIANFVAASNLDGNVGSEIIISYDSDLIPEYHRYSGNGDYEVVEIGNTVFRADFIYAIWINTSRKKQDIFFSKSGQEVYRYQYKGYDQEETTEKYYVYDRKLYNFKIFDIAGGDFNGDGTTDLLLAITDPPPGIGEVSNNVAYSLNNADGGLQYPVAFTNGSLSRVFDINKDGFDDVVVTGGKRALTLHISAGSEGFLKQVRIDANSLNTTDLEVTDMNKDGYPDIIESFDGGGSDAGDVVGDQKIRIISGKSSL